MRSDLRWSAIALAAALLGCHKHARVERGEEIEVHASEPGASAEELETAVAVPIEDAVAGVAHVAHVHTRIRPGEAVVAVELERGADADQAAFEVNQRASAILRQLPRDLPPPVVLRGTPHSDVLRYTLRSEVWSLADLTELDDDVVRTALESVPGVVGIATCGDQHLRWQVSLDPVRIAAFDLALRDVANAVREMAGSLPGGAIAGGTGTIHVAGAPVGSAAIREVVVATRGGTPVRLGDVADVRDAPEPRGCLAGDNGIRVIAGAVQAARGSDPDDVRAAIEKALAGVRASLPAGVRFDELPRTHPIELDLEIDRVERPEQVVAGLRPVPSLAHVLLEARPGTARVTLFPAEGADAHELEAYALERIPGAIVHDASELTVRLLGPDREKLAELAGAARGALAAHHLETNGGAAAPRVPRLEYVLDRDMIARYGVSTSDITDATRALTEGGLDVGYVRAGSDMRPIVLAVGDGKPEPEQLDQIELRGARGVLVPLSQLVRVEQHTGAAELLREDRQPCIAVPARGDADAIRAALARLALPPGYRWQLAAATP